MYFSFVKEEIKLAYSEVSSKCHRAQMMKVPDDTMPQVEARVYMTDMSLSSACPLSFSGDLSQVADF